MTAAELLLELDEPALRAWTRCEPHDTIKLATWEQLLHDLLACIDALKAEA